MNNYAAANHSDHQEVPELETNTLKTNIDEAYVPLGWVVGVFIDHSITFKPGLFWISKLPKS